MTIEEPLDRPVSAASGSQIPDASAVTPGDTVEVGLVRSVRFGRIIVTTVIVGAIIAALAALVVPVAPEAGYELGQIVGFMALIGAVIGLALGALLALILASVAKRQRGAALATHTDVR